MNVIKGRDVIALDTTSSYIRGGKRTIATIGLDNIVIVDSDDALLVAAKGKIQDVKKVAEEIKGRGEIRYTLIMMKKAMFRMGHCLFLFKIYLHYN